MENYIHTDELQHHGTKGMRWGIRRYQNKDGSLTPAGQKRYNKEVEKLKKEEAKVKAAEKVAANQKKTQAKFDKLDAKKQDLDARKKALKGDKSDDSKKNIEETPEQKRERLLKSSNPKELYEGKDSLSNMELQERLNRINLESQLASKIPNETKKTGIDYMNQAKSYIDASTNLYKSVDNAYSTVANSAIGKTVAKALGMEPPRKERESLSDFMKNIGKKTDKEIQDRQQVESNIKKLRDEENRQKKQAEKEAQENKSKDASGKADKSNKDNQSSNGNNNNSNSKKNENKNKTETTQNKEAPKQDSKTKEKTSDNSDKDISQYVKYTIIDDPLLTLDSPKSSKGKDFVSAYLDDLD